ncbi:hypothetical protein HPB50_007252 [Hyalomma asiaticum]|uniref:Uncharacterized protein n=1 Tax=Hyalomma asiaticum TaxID=266040 RepID=A0ACB7TC64_HYAAI|nr:hypothetical protein HPB50_007252 [Hyalomma asiaticum]
MHYCKEISTPVLVEWPSCLYNTSGWLYLGRRDTDGATQRRERDRKQKVVCSRANIIARGSVKPQSGGQPARQAHAAPGSRTTAARDKTDTRWQQPAALCRRQDWSVAAAVAPAGRITLTLDMSATAGYDYDYAPVPPPLTRGAVALMHGAGARTSRRLLEGVEKHLRAIAADLRQRKPVDIRANAVARLSRVSVE